MNKKALVFVNGFGFPRAFLGMKYWGKLPGQFAGKDFNILVLKASAFGSFIDDAARLAKDIAGYCAHHNEDDLYLVGHSRGGLIAMKAALDPAIAKRIKAVFAFNTPVVGVGFAKKIIKKVRNEESIFYRLQNLVGYIFGDKNPDAHLAIQELSRDWSGIIEEHKNSTNTHLYLVYARNRYEKMSILWKAIQVVTYGKKKTGDGIVDYSPGIEKLEIPRGEIVEYTDKGITHWAMTGLPRIIRGFRIDTFKVYDEIISRYTKTP